MKPTEVAWAAGFFDGEGWIKIQKRGDKKYLGFYLRIGINHVSPTPVEKMQSLFGGGLRLDGKVSGKRKPRYVWTLSCNQSKDFLLAIQPYLVNKCEVAQLALDFCDTIGNRGQRVSEETQLYRYMIAERIKYLNARD